MKKYIPSILVYILFCIFALALPSTEGYDTTVWKILLGQVYAIPALLISLVITLLITSKPKQKK